MNQEKWKDALELVGIVAIIGSLILVAFELRQSTAVATTQATFEINSMLDNSYRMRAQDPVLAQLIRTGRTDPGSLTKLEWDQFSAWLRADMNGVEAAWFYYNNGLILEKDHDGYRAAACSRVTTKGGRKYWLAEAKFFASRFRESIEEWCLP